MCRFLTFLITLSFFEKKVIYVEAEIYLLLRGGIREKLRDGEENNTELGWAGRKKIDKRFWGVERSCKETDDEQGRMEWRNMTPKTEITFPRKDSVLSFYLISQMERENWLESNRHSCFLLFYWRSRLYTLLDKSSSSVAEGARHVIFFFFDWGSRFSILLLLLNAVSIAVRRLELKTVSSGCHRNQVILLGNYFSPRFFFFGQTNIYFLLRALEIFSSFWRVCLFFLPFVFTCASPVTGDFCVKFFGDYYFFYSHCIFSKKKEEGGGVGHK